MLLLEQPLACSWGVVYWLGLGYGLVWVFQSEPAYAWVYRQVWESETAWMYSVAWPKRPRSTVRV